MNTTTFVPMTVNRVDYGAVYFVKVRFGLGLNTRDLNDSERQEAQTNKGAVVQVVVDGTPAYDADVLVGDVVLAIDGQPVAGAAGFTNLLRQREGRMVTLSLLRKGQKLEKKIQLQP